MATLDTSLGWVSGDVERILLAYGVGVSEYSINQMTVCCNELGGMGVGLVSRVRGLLSDYDNMVTVQKGLGVGDDAGKTLIKADVLEWKVEGSGRYEAVMKERGRIAYEIAKIFSFCSIIVFDNGSTGSSLIRS